MKELTSTRLKLRKLTEQDASFIVRLLNDPDFLKYIGDREVKNEQDAIHYIQQGPQAMYQNHDYGLLLVESIAHQQPIGLCGLLKRSELPHPDIGFAYLAQFRAQGFAMEAAKVILTDAIERELSEKLLAITSVDNEKSEGLLKKLGFQFKGLTTLNKTAHKTKLFELSLQHVKNR